ncbi:MAG: hypothetical protein B6229_02650 [Spirochaetaceae bacterium 4572_7]|nr:MAG: hypothetical protein B6229_02650 [Spirochaetaceae bacterium 4572_7]
MKVNFRDFTNKQSVHDYLVKNSKKKVVKCECRIIDDNGVVLDHLDSFVENCGDIKYYFGDDESLEINKMNSVAMFVRANGDNLKLLKTVSLV